MMVEICGGREPGRALAQRRIFAFIGLALSVALLCTSGVSQALTKTCLTGKDPAVANDAAQIGAVRAMIDTSCSCASFDGSAKGKMHGDYLKCATSVITSQIAAGNLRTQCKATVKNYCSQSTCGLTSTLGSVPCVKKLTASGKVTCAIKPATACVAKPGSYDQVACDLKTSCIDAADTNGDLIIGTGPGGTDSGTCGCPGFGLADCNGLSSDGCETNLFGDANNCGQCSRVCSAPSGGTAGCFFGTCAGQCPTGQILCLSNTDGGGVCATGQCPNLTQQAGNPTKGVSSFDFCPADDVVFGASLNVQNGHITQISTICGKLDHDKGFTTDVTLPAHGSADPSQPNQIQNLICPAADPTKLPLGQFGYVATGFQAYTDGSHVTQLSLTCAPTLVLFKVVQKISQTGNIGKFLILVSNVVFENTFTTPPVGGTGGSASPVIKCPEGFAATLTNVSADGGLDAFGLGCVGAPIGQTFVVDVDLSSILGQGCH